MRRWLSLLLALIVCLSLCPAACAAEGEAEAAADALHDLGLFSGVGTDENGGPVYALDRAPTRHEAVTMLVRLLGAEAAAQAGTWETPFTDVADWAAPYVGYAWAHGLTAGVSDTAYGGDAAVTAAQYLTFVLRALGYESGVDFHWDTAWELTDALGVTDGRYGAETPFTRGDVAIVSLAALSAAPKGGGSRALPEPEPCFEAHFIDVGQADAALVLCDGAAMLIDGGNADDSNLIYSYLQKHGVSHLDYIVCTHAHEDHVGGLAGALNYAAVDVALCPVTDYDSSAFRNFVRYLGAQGVSITVPMAGAAFALGGAEVQVVGPVSPSDEPNNTSIVLRVSYGETAFLFTGDAEREEEAEILDAGCTLDCTVLKVGHHGSATSTSYPFLYAAAPEYAVISCGAGNAYGHPAADTLSKLRDAGATVYRTDLQGDILCTSDGKTVSFTVSRNADADTLAGAGEGGSHEGGSSTAGSYLLNTNSLVFHRPDCAAAARMSARNRLDYTGTREEVLAMGYTPCAVCKP